MKLSYHPPQSVEVNGQWAQTNYPYGYWQAQTDDGTHRMTAPDALTAVTRLVEVLEKAPRKKSAREINDGYRRLNEEKEMK